MTTELPGSIKLESDEVSMALIGLFSMACSTVLSKSDMSDNTQCLMNVMIPTGLADFLQNACQKEGSDVIPIALGYLLMSGVIMATKEYLESKGITIHHKET